MKAANPLVLAVTAVALAACGTVSRTPQRVASPARVARCPATYPRALATNAWDAARAQLAPQGASAARLCRYAGLNGDPPRALVGSTLVTDRALVRGLVTDLDSLPAVASARFGCPIDSGSRITVMLAYASRHRATIVVQTSGCRIVTNGDLLRLADGYGPRPTVGPRLVAELERLTGSGRRPPPGKDAR